MGIGKSRERRPQRGHSRLSAPSASTTVAELRPTSSRRKRTVATPKPERRHTEAGVYASFDGYKTTNQIALDNVVIQEKKTSDPTDVTLKNSG